jgi:hypothetical protein
MIRSRKLNVAGAVGIETVCSSEETTPPLMATAWKPAPSRAQVEPLKGELPPPLQSVLPDPVPERQIGPVPTANPAVVLSSHAGLVHSLASQVDASKPPS